MRLEEEERRFGRIVQSGLVAVRRGARSFSNATVRILTLAEEQFRKGEEYERICYVKSFIIKVDTTSSVGSCLVNLVGLGQWVIDANALKIVRRWRHGRGLIKKDGFPKKYNIKKKKIR